MHQKTGIKEQTHTVSWIILQSAITESVRKILYFRIFLNVTFEKLILGEIDSPVLLNQLIFFIFSFFLKLTWGEVKGKAQNREKEGGREGDIYFRCRWHNVIASQRLWIDNSRSSRMFTKSTPFVHQRKIRGCMDSIFK